MQHFEQIHTFITGFIWAYKNQRIGRPVLILPKQYGGLAVLDLHKYYQVAHLGHLIDWCQHGDIKIWPNLEQAQSSALLHRAPWCYGGLPSNIKTLPLIGPTLRQCSGLFTKGKLSSSDSPLFPIFGNPHFIPGLRGGTSID